jgi:hypothetical protein
VSEGARRSHQRDPNAVDNDAEEDFEQRRDPAHPMHEVRSSADLVVSLTGWIRQIRKPDTQRFSSRSPTSTAAVVAPSGNLALVFLSCAYGCRSRDLAVTFTRDRRRTDVGQLCNDGQEERRDAGEDQQETDGYPQYSEFRFHVPSGK